MTIRRARLRLEAMLVLATCLLATALGCVGGANERPAASAPEAPEMNTLAQDYVRLVLALGQHDADYVDAYYGPPEWKPTGEKRPLGDIDADASALQMRLETMSPTAGDELVTLRHRYLTQQLSAMRTRVAMLSGTKLTFDEESKALYDAVAPTKTRQDFERVLGELERLLPGPGPLAERYEKFRARYTIPKDKLDAAFRVAIEGCRAKTLAHVTLPATESFTLEYVTGKSWSGYNWYQGNYRQLDPGQHRSARAGGSGRGPGVPRRLSRPPRLQHAARAASGA